MNIDVYTATGTKKGTASLPALLFEAPINEGLMHQAVVRQQGNRRQNIAHVKTRGEIQGSTAKLFRQKGTGRARRGSAKAAGLRGGGKSFGGRNIRNYAKDMPKKMRRAALLSCLSAQAKNGAIIGLENYPDEIKTKTVVTLLNKLPVELGRHILLVLPEQHRGLQLSARNVPNVQTVTASYLNPEDVLRSRHIIFMVEAIAKTEEVFGSGGDKRATKRIKEDAEEAGDSEEKTGKKAPKSGSKTSSEFSASSESSASSTKT